MDNESFIEDKVRKLVPEVCKITRDKVHQDAYNFILYPYPNQPYKIDGKEKFTACAVCFSWSEIMLANPEDIGAMVEQRVNAALKQAENHHNNMLALHKD